MSNPSKSLVGWNCLNCTFYHHAPGTRCVMCNELRTTRQHMRDFVMGKPVPQIADGNLVELLDDSPEKQSQPMKQQSQSQSQSQPQQPQQVIKAIQPTIQKQNQNQNSKSRKRPNPYVQTTGTSIDSFTSEPDPPIQQPLHQQNNPYVTSNNAYKFNPSSFDLSNQQCENKENNINPALVNNSTTEEKNENTMPAPSCRPHQQHFQQQTQPQEDLPDQPPAIQQQQQQQKFPPSDPWLCESETIPTNPTPPNQQPAPHKPPSTHVSKTVKKHPFAKKLPLVVHFVPGPVPHCPNAAQHWIYPVMDKYPIRQYQVEITESALFSNTLVSLPTGLGKTLIAAVVLYNYWRWFPTGQVLFLAPTLPLVNQQVQACFDIMKLPLEDTALLTGKVPPTERRILWDTRRVFYCTPQTVQKDLQNPDVCANPSRIVCIVLDEAHKASGDYAYVKVIQQLEYHCAKLRIVGLSATPGTSIKAIQHVVQALKIHTLEVRTEDDPSVAPYLNKRHDEIVIVKSNSIQAEVERDLTDIICPILKTLRDHGAINSSRFGGNRTLTPYHIHLAREEYLKRGGSGPMLGLFQAAYKLMEARSDASQSLGVCKMKLLRLKHGINRGPLATMVKGDAFGRLLEKVCTATSSSQEMPSSNPKLRTLVDLLTEHFERAKACHQLTTTKAIVFSQFRDSVSEIVRCLAKCQPLIRPRHFVGQGKAATSTGAASSKSAATAQDQDSMARLRGMKQSEQHQVIREFRSNRYNVLVCTSIGEEGLDIGEVDLIINYDCLRSPIRMIQRTGRTGRKRDGRVVCLVAEGKELQTYHQSKQAQRTLTVAMQSKTNLQLVPNTNPMLPNPRPIRLDQSMADSVGNTTFRLSQIGGHAKNRGGDGATAVASSSTTGGRSKPGDWKLSSLQEEERMTFLHYEDIPEIMISLDKETSVSAFPVSLRRHFLRGRLLASSHNKYRTGRTALLASHLESTYGIPKSQDKIISRVGKIFRGDNVLQQLFPLERTDTLTMHQSVIVRLLRTSTMMRRSWQAKQD